MREQAVITGFGLAVEDAGRTGFAALVAEAVARGGAPWVAGSSDPERWLPSAKDRKVLSHEDVLATRAASAAVDDAFPDGIPRDREVACIAFGCGKGTRQIEREAPYVGYRKPDGSIDSTAFAEAVAAAEVQEDPLRLLRSLNNNVVWWLAKHYGLGGLNLQIAQQQAPDLWSLIAAVDVIESGEHDAVLVGGTQTIEQSAVQLTGESTGFSDEAAAHVAGAAAFFVVERRTARRHDAELRLRLDTPHAPAARPLVPGAPAICGALDIYRACLAARAGGTVALIELGRPM